MNPFEGEVLCLLNPHARGGRSVRFAQALHAALSPTGAVLKSPATVELALQHIGALPHGSRVVVAGGDGSIHRLLPAVLQGGHSLGIVPIGSGNDTARALGLYKLSLSDAVARATGAKVRAFDVGWVRFNHVRGRAYEIPFASSLTAGFDSAVNERAHHGPKWLNGLPRYLFATLGELAHLQTWNLRWQTPDAAPKVQRSLMLSLLNTPSFGAGMPAAPSALTDDGLLNLLHAQAMNRLGVMGLLPKLLLGSHVRDTRVTLSRAHRLQAQSDAPIPLSADGEPLGHTMAWEAWVEPRALQVAGR